MNSHKRVFLITIDCLRADHVGCIGGDKLTPNIDRLAKDSTVYTMAFANGPGTNQSFPAILTSTYFLMQKGMRLSPKYTTISEVMKENGFKTAAFHSNPFLSSTLGWNRGFDEFYDYKGVIKSPSAFISKYQSSDIKTKIFRFFISLFSIIINRRLKNILKRIYYKFTNLEIPYLEGRELNKQVINWLEKNSRDSFFLWMHYMDPHYPYIPPDKYLSDFFSRKEAFEYNLSINFNSLSREEVVTLRKLYEGEVKYTDACIGDFIQYLKKKDLFEGSLILLMSDHGHAFLEHNKFAHAHDILYNEVLHVPLIIFGIEAGKKIDNPVQLLDVPPSILDLLNIKIPSSFIGESLYNDNYSNPIFSESAKPDLINLKYDTTRKVISCIKGTSKLIINEIQDNIELYDIKKDYRENNNLFNIKEDIFVELEYLIKKHLSNEMLKY